MTLTTTTDEGTLTGAGTEDIIATNAGTRQHVWLRLFNVSGSPVTVKIYSRKNGAVTSTQVAEIALATLEAIEIEDEIGNGDEIRAEASAAAAINWVRRLLV